MKLLYLLLSIEIACIPFKNNKTHIITTVQHQFDINSPNNKALRTQLYTIYIPLNHQHSCTSVGNRRNQRFFKSFQWLSTTMVVLPIGMKSPMRGPPAKDHFLNSSCRYQLVNQYLNIAGRSSSLGRLYICVKRSLWIVLKLEPPVRDASSHVE